MQQKQFYKPVRIFSFVVLALMVAAAVYAVSISAFYWKGIGV
jgi:hypothetical protein